MSGHFRKILSKYLKMSGFVGLYMLIYIIVQVLVIVAAAITFIISSKSYVFGLSTVRLATWINQNTSYIIFFSGLISLPFYLLVSVCRKENFFEATGFRRVSIRKILLSALLGIGACIVLKMALFYVPIERWFPNYNESMAYINEGNLFSIILGVVIMAPIIEEVIFRGFILRELRKNLHQTAAVIIQGVLFGIYHFNMLQSIYATVLGVLLGFAFVWTGSIWASIVVHIFVNGTSIFLDEAVGGITLKYILPALILGLIVSVITAHALRKQDKRS